MKALVGAFNQEKALVGAFSVIVKTGCGTDGSFYSTKDDAHILKALSHVSSVPTFKASPPQILSRDSVTVTVDAVVYFNVVAAELALCSVDDYRYRDYGERYQVDSYIYLKISTLYLYASSCSRSPQWFPSDHHSLFLVSVPPLKAPVSSPPDNCSHSTRLLAATTLRNVLGTKNLSEILSERDTISNVMKTLLDEATDPWGVRVERVEVKDVRLPVQLQRAMAAEAEAAREARAKVFRIICSISIL